MKKRDNWTKRFPVILMGMVILFGVIISSLGIYLVIKQKIILAVTLQDQYQNQLDQIRERINRQVIERLEPVLEIIHIDAGESFEFKDLIKKLKKEADKNKIPASRYFIIDTEGTFLYPPEMGPVASLNEVSDRDLNIPGESSFRESAITPSVHSTYLPLIKNREIRKSYTDGLNLEFLRNDYSKALKTYRSLLKKSRSNMLIPFYLNAMARCLFKMEQYQNAATFYQKIQSRYALNQLSQFYILYFHVIRQQAVSLFRLGDRGSAWTKYLGLYKRSIQYQKKYQSDMFVFFKNEALDYLVNFDPPQFPGFISGQFREIQKEDQKLSHSALDKRLKESYKNQNGSHWKNIGSEIPPVINTLYHRHQKTIGFYQILSENRVLLQSGSKAISLLYLGDSNPKNQFSIVYSRRTADLADVPPFFFGFQLDFSLVKDTIVPNITEDIITGNQLTLSLDQKTEESKDHIITSIPLEPYFPQHSLVLRSNQKHLIRNRIRRSTLLSIGFISLLILSFGITILLLYKYILREAQLVRLKSQFVDSVSHTLKTPLTRLSLMAETVQEGWVNDETKKQKFFRTIITETSRMNDIINRMLNFSRIETGKELYEPQAVYFQKTVEAILHQYSGDLKAEGFKIKTSIDPDLPPVWMDPNVSKLIFLNIFQNAIKYSPHRKEIHIRLEQTANDVTLEIKDFGIGISKRDIKNIFEKFFRSQDSSVRSLEGSGLGLYLVYHSLTVLGGDIRVESEKGTGSTFTVTLPVSGRNGSNA